jgi:hypothetical protein
LGSEHSCNLLIGKKAAADMSNQENIYQPAAQKARNRESQIDLFRKPRLAPAKPVALPAI